jgi:hypothetical protein
MIPSDHATAAQMSLPASVPTKRERADVEVALPQSSRLDGG